MVELGDEILDTVTKPAPVTSNCSSPVSNGVNIIPIAEKVNSTPIADEVDSSPIADEKLGSVANDVLRQPKVTPVRVRLT